MITIRPPLPAISAKRSPTTLRSQGKPAALLMAVARTAPATAPHIPVDLQEYETDFMLTADVPGLSTRDLQVQVDEATRQLTISGERQRLARPAILHASAHADSCLLGGSHAFERAMGKFERTLALGPSADPRRIHARVERGVLTVTIAKKAQGSTQPSQVRVA